MRNASRFQTSSRGSTFTCDCCKRRTRMTTQDNDSFCGQCEELLGLQNSLWDDGLVHFVPWGPHARDTLLKRIKALGGDTAAVAAYMPDLFGNGRYDVSKTEVR